MPTGEVIASLVKSGDEGLKSQVGSVAQSMPQQRQTHRVNQQGR